MSQKNNHKAQLIELINAYGAQTVADSLDVTLRSVQNYISETKPLKPHENTIRKIHEIYTKHSQGVSLKAKDETPSTDLRDQIIALQKDQIEILKQQVDVKTAFIRDFQEKFNLTLVELQKLAQVNRAYLKTLLLVQSRILSNQEKKTEEKIQSEIGTLLGEALVGAS